MVFGFLSPLMGLNLFKEKEMKAIKAIIIGLITLSVIGALSGVGGLLLEDQVEEIATLPFYGQGGWLEELSFPVFMFCLENWEGIFAVALTTTMMSIIVLALAMKWRRPS